MPIPSPAEFRNKSKKHSEVREMMAQMAENVESKQDVALRINSSEKAVMKALFARFGESKNLLTVYSATGSNNGSSSTQALLRWTGSAITVNGIFAAVRVDITGANYPSLANDASVFTSPLRVEGFANGVLKFSKQLTRLDSTRTWYFRDATVIESGITELKVFATPAPGVTIKFFNAVLHNDSDFGNPEIDARNLAIQEALSIATQDATSKADNAIQQASVDATNKANLAKEQAESSAEVKVNKVVQNSLFANLARISSNQSLIDFAQVITSRQTDGWTRIRWAKGTDILNTKGVFVAFKLDVVGAAYPTSYNDANVFSGGGMRVQAFDSVGLKYTINLVNLPNTKIWYYFGSDTDTALNVNDVTEIKVEFFAKTGVTLTVSEPVLYPDNKLPNAEPLARDKAIQDNELKLFEDRLLSNMQADNQNNLLSSTTTTHATTAQLYSSALTETHAKYSVACIIDTDGTYATANSTTEGFRARFETVNGSTTANATFLKRIGNSKVWYAKDVKVSGTFNQLKLTAVKIDGTYIKIDKAIISPNSFPDNFYLKVNEKIPSELNDLDSFVANKVSQQLSGLNIESYPTTAFDAISRAATRRVDIVAFGDSNHFMDGYGFDYALRNKLTELYGIYATPPLPGGSFGIQTGATSAQLEHKLASVSYSNVIDGSATTNNFANGVQISAAGHYRLNSASKLRCHIQYGTFSTGAGSFKAGVRIEQSPWTALKMNSVINTNKGADGYVLDYFDLEADTSRNGLPLGFKWAVPQQGAITGPFISYMMRVEDVNKVNGICFSSIYGRGGRSLWDMVSAMKGNDDTKTPDTVIAGYTQAELTNYFSEIRRLQLSKNQKPIVVIYINSALNDQNETSQPSWGWRSSTDAKSATAYIDNLEALTKTISDVWQKNDWDEKELFFWINPSHPVSTPDAAKLVAFRQAAYSWAGSRSRTSFFDFTTKITSDQMLANNYYKENGNDKNHLTLAAYEAMADLIF